MGLKTYLSWIALDIEHLSPIFTAKRIKRNFVKSLQEIRLSGNNTLRVLLGEVGVPFDITGDKYYASSTALLDRSLLAAEESDLDYTVWNYFPQNIQNIGDKWNGEDLSIRSENMNRGLLSAIRPFAVETSAGVNLFKQQFDPKSAAKKFILRIKCETIGTKHVSIFLPHFHYSPENLEMVKTSGTTISSQTEMQSLQWRDISCQKQNQYHQLEISMVF